MTCQPSILLYAAMCFLIVPIIFNVVESNSVVNENNHLLVSNETLTAVNNTTQVLQTVQAPATIASDGLFSQSDSIPEASTDESYEDISDNELEGYEGEDL